MPLESVSLILALRLLEALILPKATVLLLTEDPDKLEDTVTAFAVISIFVSVAYFSAASFVKLKDTVD